MTLKSLILKREKREAIAEYLDGQEAEERLQEVLALSAKEQEALWELAAGSREALSTDFFVPKQAKRLIPYPFEGKNSLPLFTRFQKIFYRTREKTIGGYNEQPLRWFTGPGYYCLEVGASGDPGPLFINYCKVPRSKPASFPRIRSNDAIPTRFIYGGMKDFLRRVSSDVVIGRAYRKEKPMPNFFLLCRPKRRRD